MTTARVTTNKTRTKSGFSSVLITKSGKPSDGCDNTIIVPVETDAPTTIQTAVKKDVLASFRYGMAIGCVVVGDTGFESTDGPMTDPGSLDGVVSTER